MEDKKAVLLKCVTRAFGIYTVASFVWIAFCSIIANAGAKNADGVAEMLEYLVKCNVFILIFSLVFGFSFLIFALKNMSQAAKRAIHIFLNYIASMLCFYGLNSAGKESTVAVWITIMLFATFAYFAIYGVFMLVAFIIKRKKAN